MPFKPNADHNFPTVRPDVEIRFGGLLLLVPVLRDDQGTNCIVGVLQAQEHALKVTVTDRGSLGSIPTPTGRPITTPFKIYAGNSGVTKFVSTPVETAFPGTERDHPRDFRWSLDLKALHQSSTPASSPGRLNLAATLSDGLLFTALRTEPAKLAIHLKHPSTGLKCWNRIAAELGAFIQLAANQKLTLEWEDQGTRKLELAKGGGTGGEGYLVRIDNLPDDASAHDDFEAYYDYAIDTADPRYDLFFYRRIGIDIGAGVDAPCMSGAQDGDGRT
ncbi:MAG TPA: hypothetical protein VNO50_16970 [Pyrinomonadaceae bacterium]|nr:hypothetical protein [Pyrinomonadaceae bacterium]